MDCVRARKETFTWFLNWKDVSIRGIVQLICVESEDECEIEKSVRKLQAIEDI